MECTIPKWGKAWEKKFNEADSFLTQLKKSLEFHLLVMTNITQINLYIGIVASLETSLTR